MAEITYRCGPAGWLARANGLATIGKTECEATRKLLKLLDLVDELTRKRLEASP